MKRTFHVFFGVMGCILVAVIASLFSSSLSAPREELSSEIEEYTPTEAEALSILTALDKTLKQLEGDAKSLKTWRESYIRNRQTAVSTRNPGQATLAIESMKDADERAMESRSRYDGAKSAVAALIARGRLPRVQSAVSDLSHFNSQLEAAEKYAEDLEKWK